MSTQNFLIAPLEVGLETDRKPWLIPESAFPEMEDIYLWHGRAMRKDGFEVLGRLELTGTPAGLGNANGVTFAGVIATTPISPGSVVISVAAAPPIVFTDNGNGTLSSPTVDINFGTLDYESGIFNLYFTPALAGPFVVTVTEYKYLPVLPVMGLRTYQVGDVNKEELIAFDTRYSYLQRSGTDRFDVLNDIAAAPQIWSGTDYNFFYTSNYQYSANRPLFWAVNDVPSSIAGGQTRDGIQIFNGVSWFAQTPIITGPTVAPAQYLRGAKILLPYKDRMVALGTWEGGAIPAGTAQFRNRARWSQNGTAYTNGLTGAVATAWDSDTVGRGGYYDAPTNEAIVGAEYLKDTLIVFFEQSTWQLRYTGLEILPFVWEQINSDFGCESTFSTISFDKNVLAVGDRAIVGANQINVERVDEKNPFIVFDFKNRQNGTERIHGIRDFYRELALWTYVDDSSEYRFPNKVFVYNYQQNSFAKFTDSFTCFGRYQDVRDFTWATVPYKTWDDWDRPWNDPVEAAYFQNVIAGNQKGFVLKLDEQSQNDVSLDVHRNAGGITITAANPAVMSIVDHNLDSTQFIQIMDTTAFPINVVNESEGTAAIGDLGFTETLDFLGVFPGTITFIVTGVGNLTDLGNGVLASATAGLTGTISYEDGSFTLAFPALAAPALITASYTYNIINFRVFSAQPTGADTVALFEVLPSGVFRSLDTSAYVNYTGSGSVAYMNNFKLKTKRLNPFIKDSMKFRVPFIDLYLDRSTSGNFTMNVKVDDQDSGQVNSLTGTSVREWNPNVVGERYWHRLFPNVVGAFLQLEFTMNPLQMVSILDLTQEFTLNGVNINCFPSGRLIGFS